MAIPVEQWEWFGYPAHLIVADSCRFHMVTKVGAYLVSSVGDYRSPIDGKRTTIGCGEEDYFETYVFTAGLSCTSTECGCGLPTLADSSEIDSARSATAGACQRDHMDMCAKYAAMDGV